MTHSCHNPNCGKPLPARLVSHKSSWFALPKLLRDAIWRHYRKGQEVDKRPSKGYLMALAHCVQYWRDNNIRCEERHND